MVSTFSACVSQKKCNKVKQIGNSISGEGTSIWIDQKRVALDMYRFVVYGILQTNRLMNRVNQILSMYGVISPTTMNESNPLMFNAVPDTESSVKGRNVPKEVKPQAYCHPRVSKAHNGVSPEKEKKIIKNRIRRKHKD